MWNKCKNHSNGDVGMGCTMRKKSWKQGNPPSNTIKDTIIILKEFIVDVWEVRKQKLYGEDTCPSHHQCQTLAGDAGPVTGGGGLRVSKMGRLQDKAKLGKLGKFHVQVCSGNVHAI